MPNTGPQDPNVDRRILSRSGARPTLRQFTLGPYIVGKDPDVQEALDLDTTLGIIREYAITVTAIDFDGNDPGNSFDVDFDVSLDGIGWVHGEGTDIDAAPDRPRMVGAQPGPFYEPGTLRGNLWVPRFIRPSHTWDGPDIGDNATATYHVTLEVF